MELRSSGAQAVPSWTRRAAAGSDTNRWGRPRSRPACCPSPHCLWKPPCSSARCRRWSPWGVPFFLSLQLFPRVANQGGSKTSVTLKPFSFSSQLTLVIIYIRVKKISSIGVQSLVKGQRGAWISDLVVTTSSWIFSVFDLVHYPGINGFMFLYTKG